MRVIKTRKTDVNAKPPLTKALGITRMPMPTNILMKSNHAAPVLKKIAKLNILIGNECRSMFCHSPNLILVWPVEISLENWCGFFHSDQTQVMSKCYATLGKYDANIYYSTALIEALQQNKNPFVLAKHDLEAISDIINDYCWIKWPILKRSNAKNLYILPHQQAELPQK